MCFPLNCRTKRYRYSDNHTSWSLVFKAVCLEPASFRGLLQWFHLWNAGIAECWCGRSLNPPKLGNPIVTIVIWLVVYLSLWKYEFVSWGYEIPNWMESHKSHVPNHQPYIYIERVQYNTIVFIGLFFPLTSSYITASTSFSKHGSFVSQSFRCTVLSSLNGKCILNLEATHQKIKKAHGKLSIYRWFTVFT